MAEWKCVEQMNGEDRKIKRDIGKEREGRERETMNVLPHSLLLMT